VIDTEIRIYVKTNFCVDLIDRLRCDLTFKCVCKFYILRKCLAKLNLGLV